MYEALSYHLQVFCFALNAGDGSSIRSQIEHAAQHFVDLTPLLAVSLVTAAEVHPEFTSFSGTKVQILTLTRMPRKSTACARTCS